MKPTPQYRKLIICLFALCLCLSNCQLDEEKDNASSLLFLALGGGNGSKLKYQKISSLEGNFTGTLDDEDEFGCSVASIGDLDGDGVKDIAVGAHKDDDGISDQGAVWILFLNADGTVKSHQKISDTEGGFTGELTSADRFGYSVADIGDLDNDGVRDIAVGAPTDDDGGQDRGAVWILFLNSDGTVKAHQKISDTDGGFTETLLNSGQFGISVSGIGDFDSDGAEDIAVGASQFADGGTGRGAIWIILLNSNGTVKAFQRISDTQGGFTGTLADNDSFGSSIANIGDLDSDSVTDIAVGALGDSDGGSYRGAVWILFLNADGTVKAHQKISDTEGAFTGILGNFDFFGKALSGIGDLNGDGVSDIVVGAYGDDDGGGNKGAIWILLLNTNGTVKSHQKISDTAGTFNGTLYGAGFFGSSVTAIDDLNGDGISDLVVGNYEDNDGGTDRGAVWILGLDSDGTVKQ